MKVLCEIYEASGSILVGLLCGLFLSTLFEPPDIFYYVMTSVALLFVIACELFYRYMISPRSGFYKLYYKFIQDAFDEHFEHQDTMTTRNIGPHYQQARMALHPNDYVFSDLHQMIFARAWKEAIKDLEKEEDDWGWLTYRKRKG